MKNLSSKVHQFFIASRYTEIQNSMNTSGKGVITMKYLGVWLAGGVTLIVILAIGIFSFLPQETPPQPAVVVVLERLECRAQCSCVRRHSALRVDVKMMVSH